MTTAIVAYVATGLLIAAAEQCLSKDRSARKTALRFIGYPTFGTAVVALLLPVCFVVRLPRMVGYVSGKIAAEYRKGYQAGLVR